MNKSFIKTILIEFSVFLFSASITWFIIFSAYYRQSIKPVLLGSCVALAIISFQEKKSGLSKYIPFILRRRQNRAFQGADNTGTAQYSAPKTAGFSLWSFIFLSISVIISTIFSKDFKHSAGIFIERYFLYFLTFEIGRRFFADKTVSRVLAESFGTNIFNFTKYIFIFAGFLMGLGGIVDYIRFHPQRLFSIFGQEIQFLMLPLYIIYFLPIVYCFMFKENTFLQRIFAILTFIMLVMCMIFTGSRTAWIAGPLSILFALLLINKKHLKYFILGFFIYLGIIYFFMQARIIGDFGTYYPRKDIMLAAIGIFRDNLFFGAGPGMYEKLIYSYSKGAIYIHAHNTYLEVLAELGIIGLIAFLTVFIYFYSQVLKNFSRFNNSANKFLYTGLLASNIACLIFAFFGSIITVGFHDAPMFWLIFGMCWGLKNFSISRGRINNG